MNFVKMKRPQCASIAAIDATARHFSAESASNASTISWEGVYVDCDTAEVDGGGGGDEGEATAAEALAAGVPAIGCGGAGN